MSPSSNTPVPRLTSEEIDSINAAYADAEAAIQDRRTARKMGPDWQAGRHEPRDLESEITTPSLEEMAQAPGTTQTKYCVTYERVGRHGGRTGSKPPAPLTVWALSADGLAEKVYDDIAPYLLSRGYEVHVDLERMRGQIFTGLNNGGSFTVEVVQVAAAAAARTAQTGGAA